MRDSATSSCAAEVNQASNAGGVYLPPSAFEAWFTSAAHDDVALSRIAAALPAAALAAASVLSA